MKRKLDCITPKQQDEPQRDADTAHEKWLWLYLDVTEEAECLSAVMTDPDHGRYLGHLVHSNEITALPIHETLATENDMTLYAAPQYMTVDMAKNFAAFPLLASGDMIAAGTCVLEFRAKDIDLVRQCYKDYKHNTTDDVVGYVMQVLDTEPEQLTPRSKHQCALCPLKAFKCYRCKQYWQACVKHIPYNSPGRFCCEMCGRSVCEKCCAVSANPHGFEKDDRFVCEPCAIDIYRKMHKRQRTQEPKE
jgi:hypothetical protein